MDEHLVETKIRSEEILKSDFLHTFRDTVALPNGLEATREYVVHPGAAMIVPIFSNGDLLMERQYRYPMQQVMIEFPAGKLNAGESSLLCAQREFKEETGYTARYWARAGMLHPVISYSTEYIDIWLAKDLQEGTRQLDEGEHLDLITVAFNQAMDWCRDGQITDCKTLIGMMWLQNHLSGAWPLNWQSS